MKENLARLEERWDSYGGNNPIKYRAAIKTARLEVGLIESHFRADGTLPTVPPRPLTEKQLLENELNEAFPTLRAKRLSRTRARNTNGASGPSIRACGLRCEWRQSLSERLAMNWHGP